MHGGAVCNNELAPSCQSCQGGCLGACAALPRRRQPPPLILPDGMGAPPPSPKPKCAQQPSANLPCMTGIWSATRPSESTSAGGMPPGRALAPLPLYPSLQACAAALWLSMHACPRHAPVPRPLRSCGPMLLDVLLKAKREQDPSLHVPHLCRQVGVAGMLSGSRQRAVCKGGQGTALPCTCCFAGAPNFNTPTNTQMLSLRCLLPGALRSVQLVRQWQVHAALLRARRSGCHVGERPLEGTLCVQEGPS